MEEEEAGVRERRGVLKVVVASGTNLAVRDFTSSDPYVVVRLAAMNKKTKVINSCLNPVWNEEMSFSIEEPAGVIKFVGFSVPSPSQNLISIKILDLIKRWYSTGL
jgi:Ca2+-dependent lipid-binding protein